MKLNDESLNWMYQQTNEFKKALATLDYLRVHKRLDRTLLENISDNILSMALSFLMVAMGDHVPKELYTVDDFSVLYGVIDDHREDTDINLRDYW